MIKSFFLGFFLSSTLWLGAYIVWTEYQEKIEPEIRPIPVIPFEDSQCLPMPTNLC